MQLVFNGAGSRLGVALLIGAFSCIVHAQGGISSMDSVSFSGHSLHLKSAVEPDFPIEATGYSGHRRVVVRAVIGADGRVTAPDIRTSDDSSFNKSSLEAASQCAFQGASKEGEHPDFTQIVFDYKVDADAGVAPDYQTWSFRQDTVFVLFMMPHLLNRPKPEYPEAARAAGKEGEVDIKILIGKDGIPRKPLIVSSSDPVFNDPAINAMMRCRFRPAIKHGQPVAVWTTVPFHFKKQE
jgi:TonB family protein